MQVYEAVVEAGASTINIPDTVGYAIPSEFGALVGRAVALLGSQATISVHCHNDLGLATANTLAAVQAGARQVEVTINGLGERAGNASLEEVVMALRTRPTQFRTDGGGSSGTDEALTHGVQTEHITAASRLVSYLTGFAVQPNKAVVGGNAFAHESGIHQDGVIKNPLTYEIMTPQSVGLAGSSITIGKLSGRQGAWQRSSPSWATSSRARRSTPSTARRSSSPTRRRRSPTTTSWPSSSSASPRCRRPSRSRAGT